MKTGVSNGFTRLSYGRLTAVSTVLAARSMGRSAFNQAWLQLLTKVRPGDEVALFFSGHGVEIEL
jgi:hypothetical protein